MNDRAYAGDVILMLGMLATFGMAGAAIAVLITLCRHSPIVIGGIVDLAEYTTGSRPALLSSPRVAALLPGAVSVLDRPPREITDKAPRLTLPRFAPEEPRRQTATPDRPRWMAAVNDEPDRAPHTLIIGPTGSGKTTMACAALGARPDRTVVLSPKVNAGNWRGAEVATLDDDGTYEPLSRALEELEQEKRERIVALRKHGADALEPLTIVLDETPELVRFVPRAGDFIGSMSSIGRELKMRLVVLSTSSRVKDLGIEGRGAALENFIRVDLDRDRRATLNDGIRTIAVSTKEVQTQARAAHLRPWRGDDLPEMITHAEQLPLPQPEPDDLLATLLATMSPERAARLQSVTVQREQGDVIVNVNPATVTQRVRTKPGIDRKRRLGYIEAARSGEKFEPTYQRLGGSRNVMHALFTAHRPK